MEVEGGCTYSRLSRIDATFAEDSIDEYSVTTRDFAAEFAGSYTRNVLAMILESLQHKNCYVACASESIACVAATFSYRFQYFKDDCTDLDLVYKISHQFSRQIAFLNPVQKTLRSISAYAKPGKHPNDTISSQNNFITSTIFYYVVLYGSIEFLEGNKV